MIFNIGGSTSSDVGRALVGTDMSWVLHLVCVEDSQ